jgi:hydroxyacyl-ACP dehydratase HTD2-like protein with hotdog domain
MRLGEEVQRVSSIEKVQHKTGRSGELLFVQVLHTFSNAQGVCLEETHDIVFRPDADPNAAPLPGVTPVNTAVWQRDIVPDDVLLFRYSALTFNSHRIHYDRRYVTQVEGYPGLIVHGPLMARCWSICCADTATAHCNRLSSKRSSRCLNAPINARSVCARTLMARAFTPGCKTTKAMCACKLLPFGLLE